MRRVLDAERDRLIEALAELAAKRRSLASAFAHEALTVRRGQILETKAAELLDEARELDRLVNEYTAAESIHVAPASGGTA